MKRDSESRVSCFANESCLTIFKTVFTFAEVDETVLPPKFATFSRDGSRKRDRAVSFYGKISYERVAQTERSLLSRIRSRRCSARVKDIRWKLKSGATDYRLKCNCFCFFWMGTSGMASAFKEIFNRCHARRFILKKENLREYNSRRGSLLNFLTRQIFDEILSLRVCLFLVTHNGRCHTLTSLTHHHNFGPNMNITGQIVRQRGQRFDAQAARD